MSSLFDSLRAAGSALEVYQHAMTIVQSNVTNATTPGYAKQRLQLEARLLDLASGLAGGVADRGLDSARDEFAEDEVRRQLHLLGFAEAGVGASAALERLFDVSGQGSVSGALTRLFRAFSAWSAAPGDPSARASVIDAAGLLAGAIRAHATALSETAEQTRAQIGATVTRINELAATIQSFNIERQQHAAVDPGQDASAHAALEELAQLVDFTAITQADGSFTVVLNGGAPLVIGERLYPLAAGRAFGRIPGPLEWQDGQVTAPIASDGLSGRLLLSGASGVLDWEGRDATSQITGGRLGGLLDAAHRMIPNAQASLDGFAFALASTVNGILAAGSPSPDSAPPGEPLFQFDDSQPARTLAVSDTITPADLAAVDAAGNANGNALKLASLANSASAGGFGRLTFGEYFSGIASTAGRESADAQRQQDVQRQVANQARSLRDRLSGVSLDEEAMLLMQFQRSYQAAARLVRTIDDMAGEILNMVR